MNQRGRVLATMVLLLCGIAVVLAGCYPRAQSAIYVGKDCQLVDRNGRVLTYLPLEPGRSVIWVNPTPNDVVLIFSSHKIVGGSVSVRLAAGESRTFTVGSYTGGKFSWRLVCRPQDYPPPAGGEPDKGDEERETDGDGGPPTPIDPPICPPPPQPCEPGE